LSPAEPGRIQALICEDEPLARRALHEYLSDVEWIEIVADAENGRDALRLIHKLEPDLVFLDVRMPGMSGLEVLDSLTHEPAIVFTTAYDEYAVRAFDLGAVDYLVKPFGRERLLETLARVRVRLLGEGLVGGGRAAAPDDPEGRASRRRLFARHKGGIVPVATDTIVRIDAAAGRVTVHCGPDRYEMDATLAELEARLDPADFVRIHRSHVVNLRHVASIRRYDDRRLEVRLSDGSSVVTSRHGSKALRDLMNT
jgi:two-component system LytT family response regulator